jgi:peptidoglycan glycosyltransferase
VLAHAGDGIYYYADDALTRTSCFHVVGDYAGNVGTGALTAFSDRLAGYNLVNGTYSRAGQTVALTVDAELNNVAYTALAGRSGAVLVMDYTTGEILCMVSSVSYDPNSGADVSGYDGVFINRAISSVYTPGSVFKLVTLAAAIENISDLSSRSFYCAGSVDVGGDTVVCSGVHGTQTIEQALANSCNCAFAEISLELGSDLICKYAEDFGFTSTHDLNGITTAAGTVESASAGSSDLAWSGIGQYTDLVSPFAMLRYVAAIANGGEVAEPTLLPGESSGTTRLLGAGTAAKIADMMENNVTSSYGTWSFPGLSLAAKSGTAETGRGTSHAWFAGFLTDTDTPYAFVVIVEDGGGGLSVAGPVANAVLQAAIK